MNNYFVSLVESKEFLYREWLSDISFNKKTYVSYVKQTEMIGSYATEELCKSINFNLKKFLKYENHLFNQNILPQPIVDLHIICKISYTSPKGRNSYCKEQIYNCSDLESCLDYITRLRAEKNTRQNQISRERAKLTPSLRYDIFSRDNFRCQICGSSVEDGVKLHVDHIIPVSKGGKTIPNNLRTLCDRCNLGKSNKTY